MAAFFIIGLIAAAYLVNINEQKEAPLLNPPPSIPSETFINYSDPAGFTFSYPDNLSIKKNDIEDNSTYADLELSAKEVNGSLSLKIADSKYKTLNDWVKLNKGVTKETKLGNLKALEVQTPDRILLGALDQGIFFKVEMPKIEEKFWEKVYSKMLASFSFASPSQAEQTDSSSGDVTFESEEVVE